MSEKKDHTYIIIDDPFSPYRDDPLNKYKNYCSVDGRCTAGPENQKKCKWFTPNQECENRCIYVFYGCISPDATEEANSGK